MSVLCINNPNTHSELVLFALPLADAEAVLPADGVVVVFAKAGVVAPVGAAKTVAAVAEAFLEHRRVAGQIDIR